MSIFELNQMIFFIPTSTKSYFINKTCFVCPGNLPVDVCLAQKIIDPANKEILLSCHIVKQFKNINFQFQLYKIVFGTKKTVHPIQNLYLKPSVPTINPENRYQYYQVSELNFPSKTLEIWKKKQSEQLKQIKQEQSEQLKQIKQEQSEQLKQIKHKQSEQLKQIKHKQSEQLKYAQKDLTTQTTEFTTVYQSKHFSIVQPVVSEMLIYSEPKFITMDFVRFGFFTAGFFFFIFAKKLEKLVDRITENKNKKH